MSVAPGTRVFVSYSSADAPLVTPVVQLLRANKSLVFQDVDSIRPGKRWRGEIADALADSGLVVLFWCDHASRSKEVAKEWQAALTHGKDLLPLLLDATPLPAELREYQWIDFRATVGPSHGSIDSPRRSTHADGTARAAAAKSVRWWPLAGVAAVFVGALALGLVTFNAPHSPVPGIRPEVPGTQPPPSGPGDGSGDVLLGMLLVLGAIAALSALVTWRVRSRRARAAVAPQQLVERRIADEVEAEILRRTATLRRHEQ